MKSRTNLSVMVIFDLESAYQLYLASVKRLEIEDVIEAIVWNEVLKRALIKIGAENFVSLYHCHPEFIYQEIICRRELETKINQSIENADCLLENICKMDRF